MKYLLIVFLAFPLYIFGQTIQENLEIQLDKILKREVFYDAELVPGFNIALIDLDSSWVLSRGHQVNNLEPLRPEDVFEWAGLSKAITAYGIMQYVDRGVISLEKTLSECFPSRNLSQEIGEINIQDLLNHTSGIPKKLIDKNDDPLIDPLTEIDEETFWKLLQKTSIKDRGSFQYAHHNYALLQLIIEKELDLTLEEFYTKEFNLMHSIISFSPIEGISRGGSISEVKNYDVYTASIGLGGSIEDLIYITQKYLLPYYSKTFYKNTEALVQTKLNKDTKIYNGWYALNLTKKRYLFSHAGGNKRHRVSIQMIPDTDTAVILLCNSEIGIQQLSLASLRMLNHNWKKKR